MNDKVLYRSQDPAFSLRGDRLPESQSALRTINFVTCSAAGRWIRTTFTSIATEKYASNLGESRFRHAVDRASRIGEDGPHPGRTRRDSLRPHPTPGNFRVLPTPFRRWHGAHEVKRAICAPSL